MRKQSVAQHAGIQLPLIADRIMIRLRSYVSVDEALVKRAVERHDDGEGLVRFRGVPFHEIKAYEAYDVLYPDKCDSSDLEEYEAFAEATDMLWPNVRLELHRAFLLQFARRNPAKFPSEAREIMSALWEENHYECIMFEAIERMGYLFHSLEQFLNPHYSANRMLGETLDQQGRHLDRLCEELPGFKKEIWTPDLRGWAEWWFLDFPECAKPDLPQEESWLAAIRSQMIK